MSSLHGYSNALTELWCCHEFFRSLGYLPESIYVLTRPFLGCAVKYRDKRYTISITEPISQDQADIYDAEWMLFVPELASGAITDDELKVAWEASRTRGMSVQIITDMVLRGFPQLANAN